MTRFWIATLAALAIFSTGCPSKKKKGPAPEVLSIEPSLGWNGSTTSVTITGGGFLDGVTVWLDADPQIDLTGVTLVSGSNLTASVPSGIAPGTYAVHVMNLGSKIGVLEPGFVVTAQAPPAITAVQPGTISNLVSNTIAVVGANFVSTPTLTIGGTAIGGVTFVDSGRIEATLAAGALAVGTYSVTVTNPDTQWGTLAGALTVTADQPPSIQDVTPSAVSILQAGAQEVIVKGAGFTPDATFALMMGTSSGNPTLIAVSSTQLNFSVTPSTMLLGGYDLIVTNDAGTGLQIKKEQGFEVVDDPPPTITSVTPSSGFNGEKTTINIGGTDFISTPRVFILGTNGSAEATNVGFVSDTGVSAVVPAGLAPGNYTVRLVNPKPFDLSGQKVDAFRATDIRPPRIDAMAPDAFASSSGGTAKITGDYFDTTTPAKVFVDTDKDLAPDAGLIGAGGEQVNPASVSVTATEITVVIPGGIGIGLHPIIVQNGDLQIAHYFSLSLTSDAAGKLNSDTTWDAASTQKTARQFHGTETLRDNLGNAYLYTIGGDHDGNLANAPRADGEFAPVSVLGQMGTSNTLRQRDMDGNAIDNLMLYPRQNFALVSASNHLYAIGGFDGAMRLKFADKSRILRTDQVPVIASGTTDATIGRLQSGTWYYRVSAWFFEDGETLPSESFGVFAADGGSVTITWNAMNHPTIADNQADYYHVYRALSADGAAASEVYVATVPGNTLSFTDDGNALSMLVPNSAAPARVRARAYVDNSGTLLEGRYFYRVSAIVHGEETYGSYRGRDRIATGENAIRLTWPSLPNATEYRVFRSPTPDADAGLEVLLTTVMQPATGDPEVIDLGSFTLGTDKPLEGSPYLPVGSLSGWSSVEGIPMTSVARDGLRGAVAVGDGKTYLYALGGFDGTSYLTEVLFTSVDSNGVLKPWVVTTAMGVARSELGVATVTSKNSGGKIAAGQTMIYAVRGRTGLVTQSDKIEGAFINPVDGTLTPWATKDNNVTGSLLSEHRAIVTNGNVYVIGGVTGLVYQNKIQTACVFDSNGTIGSYTGPNCVNTPGGAYQDSGSTMTSNRARHGLTFTRGFYFLTGGTPDGTTVLDTTETHFQ